jgi:hypothetical protein
MFRSSVVIFRETLFGIRTVSVKALHCIIHSESKKKYFQVHLCKNCVGYAGRFDNHDFFFVCTSSYLCVEIPTLHVMFVVENIISYTYLRRHVLLLA